MSAKLAACDSGKPYSANDVIDRTISSAASPVMPFCAMPSRSRCSICCIRFTDRLKPIARRSSSASPPENPATTIAIRSNCS